MASRFDSRIVPEESLALIRACQARAPSCHLAGGAALSGLHLKHRLSADLDLFCHERADVRALLRELPEVAREVGARIEVVQDSGSFVRATVHGFASALALDLVHEPAEDLEPVAGPIEGVMVASSLDLRASKITCLLNRSEPRDLVDLLFVERAGHPVEGDLASALRKDAGIDPGVLAWLLSEFPLSPLPQMLVPLTLRELTAFRDDLGARLARLAVPQ